MSTVHRGATAGVSDEESHEKKLDCIAGFEELWNSCLTLPFCECGPILCERGVYKSVKNTVTKGDGFQNFTQSKKLMRHVSGAWMQHAS